jgi:sialate O-acetylesterase
MNRILFFLYFAIVSSLQTLKGDVKLPALFGDNMVLQQESNVALWGWAEPNSTVKIQSSWNKKSCKVKADTAGFWKVKIQTPSASFTSHTLTVSQKNTLTLENVLIGEVWLCSGQSNMEMPMKGFESLAVAGAPDEILVSRNQYLRLFTVEKKSTLHLQTDCAGSWLEASPGTVIDFSATAYYFGKMLFRNLNIPVGLIHASWGGSNIEAWMPSELFDDIPGKTAPEKQEDIKSANKTPAVLYNGMINPLVGYGIRGVIWYQGEANRKEPDLYVSLFGKMVQKWRELWASGTFPFYYCQIAPNDYAGGVPYAFMREAQAKCMKTVPNTGMAVLMDSDCHAKNHPPEKRNAGERLARWALAETYGIKGLPYKSPEPGEVEITGRLVTITVENIGASSGLTTYGKDIRNFQVAGINKIFYPGIAAVDGNKIFVFSPQVEKPVAVRYCFETATETEIFSIDAHLPLSSFRTDNW